MEKGRKCQPLFHESPKTSVPPIVQGEPLLGRGVGASLFVILELASSGNSVHAVFAFCDKNSLWRENLVCRLVPNSGNSFAEKKNHSTLVGKPNFLRLRRKLGVAQWETMPAFYCAVVSLFLRPPLCLILFPLFCSLHRPRLDHFRRVAVS